MVSRRKPSCYRRQVSRAAEASDLGQRADDLGAGGGEPAKFRLRRPPAKVQRAIAHTPSHFISAYQPAITWDWIE